MGDTLMTVIAIFLAVILLFLFPMLSVSERADDISQLAVETAVSNFVDNSRAIGKITIENYEQLVNALNATGNSYDIELEVKKLDENVGKKTAWTDGQVIGENVYYSVYTSQILDTLLGDTANGREPTDYLMKEGDILACTAKNNNTTFSQTLRSVFYSISSNNAYQVGAERSGMVTATGLR